MNFSSSTTVFVILLALLVSLVTCRPAPAAGTPNAAALAARATVALERPQFPRVNLNLLLAKPLQKNPSFRPVFKYMYQIQVLKLISLSDSQSRQLLVASRGLTLWDSQ